MQAPFLSAFQARQLRKAARPYKNRVKFGPPWDKRTEDDLWRTVLSQIVVVGSAAPAERLQRDPNMAKKVAIRHLKKCHSDVVLQKHLHKVLVEIGTRYVSKKKGWKEDRKARAAVCNFRALMKAGGPKRFFKRVAALPTEKERIQFLSNGETFQYYGKKGARDTLIELGLAKECLALDARILGLLEKVGVEIKRSSLDRDYERIEEELIEKVAKPLDISGARLDRVLFQYNNLIVGGV
jgi:hypothetical protein